MPIKRWMPGSEVSTRRAKNPPSSVSRRSCGLLNKIHTRHPTCQSKCNADIFVSTGAQWCGARLFARTVSSTQSAHSFLECGRLHITPLHIRQMRSASESKTKNAVVQTSAKPLGDDCSCKCKLGCMQIFSPVGFGPEIRCDPMSCRVKNVAVWRCSPAKRPRFHAIYIDTSTLEAGVSPIRVPLQLVCDAITVR